MAPIASTWNAFKAGEFDGRYGMYEFGEDVVAAIEQDDHDTLREMLTYDFKNKDIMEERAHTMACAAIYRRDFDVFKMAFETAGDKIDCAWVFHGNHETGDCNLLSYACACNDLRSFLYILDHVDLKTVLDEALMLFISDRHPDMLRALIDRCERDGIPFLKENHSNYKTNKLTVDLYRGLYWTFIESNGDIYDDSKQIGKMLDPLLDMNIVRDIAKYGNDFDKEGAKPDDLEDELNEFFSEIFPSYVCHV